MPQPNPDHQAIFDGFLARRRAQHPGMTMTLPTPPAPTPPAPAPAPPATPPAPPVEDRSFTQDQLTGIVTRETAQARAAAQTALLQELGFDSADAAKAALQAAEAARQAQLSEAQRAQEAAATAAATAQQANATAQALGQQYQVDLALLRVGVIPDGTPEGDKKIAGIRRLVNVPAGADAAAITAAVEQAKTLYPALFTTGTPPVPPQPPAPGSDPKGRPPAPVVGDSAYERGMQRAQSRGTAGADGPKIVPVG